MNLGASMRNGLGRVANAARSVVAAIGVGIGKITNRYEGAVNDGMRSNIPGQLQGARFDASAATRKELVRKSRYFERNSALVNRLADLFEAYTVGGGLVFQPNSSSEEWNKAAKAAWDEWCVMPDASSRLPMSSIQSLAARSWFIDGEVFIHLAEGSSSWRPRIQLFESHLCKSPQQPDNTNDVFDGVKLDPASGRPLLYYFGSEGLSGNVTNLKPFSTDVIVHLWEPSRPQMVRSLPYLYPVLNLLHDLDDLQILEMKVAKQAARIGIVTKNQAGEQEADEFLRNGGSVTSSSDPEREAYYRNSLGGEEIVMKTGDSLEQFRSDRPTIVTMEYWRHLQSQVCMGVGIPYVVAFPDSMQGTVYRGALDMANAWFLCRHAVLASAFRRVYEHFMGRAIYSIPALKDPPADWKNVRIHPPKAVNVDVGRNSNAMLAELAAGSLTYSEIFGQKGQDWREGLTQRKAEQDFIESLGLKLQVSQVQTAAQVEQIQQNQQQGVPA